MHNRKCSLCGGKVFLAVSKSTIEHPARDERGREIFELKQNKQTGQWHEQQVMVTWPIRGLGTWKCTNGCGREGSVTKHIPVRAA